MSLIYIAAELQRAALLWLKVFRIWLLTNSPVESGNTAGRTIFSFNLFIYSAFLCLLNSLILLKIMAWLRYSQSYKSDLRIHPLAYEDPIFFVRFPPKFPAIHSLPQRHLSRHFRRFASKQWSQSIAATSSSSLIILSDGWQFTSNFLRLPAGGLSTSYLWKDLLWYCEEKHELRSPDWLCL